MARPRTIQTWPDAVVAATTRGHQVLLCDPLPGFWRHARCLQCGGLLLALSESDAFGEITRHACPTRPHATTPTAPTTRRRDGAPSAA